jgi:hypothetical protein
MTGRSLALLLVLFVAGIASLAGVFGGRGLAALVLVGTALLGAVSALWSSLHELASEDVLEEVRELPSLARVATDDELEAVLRALIDLDHEVAVGKILPGDEGPVRHELRSEAKRLLQLQDARIRPEARERARLIVEGALASASQEVTS